MGPRPRLVALSTSLLIIAAILSGQAEVSPSPPALDPVCELAFELAATAAGSLEPEPAPPATPAAPDPTRLDVAIRACASLADWAAGAALYPQALSGADALAVLLERCADAISGLAPFPVCAGLGAPPSAQPSAAASPDAPPSAAPEAPPSAALLPTANPTAAPPSEEPGEVGPTARLVRLPRFDTRVRGADRLRTFAIRGSSPDELLRQMQEQAARVCPQHASACTFTQPRIRPRISGNPAGGSCRVIGIQLSTDDRVNIPRWSGPGRVYPELVAWWRKVNAHVRWHEAQHIRISRQHVASLRKRLVGKPCSRINAEVQRMSQRLQQAQAAFDARDQGWLPTYDGPLP